MWRVTREVLQGRKASTAENMKFSGKKIIAIKSDNILPYFKANLFLYQTLPLTQSFGVENSLRFSVLLGYPTYLVAVHNNCLMVILSGCFVFVIIPT